MHGVASKQVYTKLQTQPTKSDTLPSVTGRGNRL